MSSPKWFFIGRLHLCLFHMFFFRRRCLAISLELRLSDLKYLPFDLLFFAYFTDRVLSILSIISCSVKIVWLYLVTHSHSSDFILSTYMVFNTSRCAISRICFVTALSFVFFCQSSNICSFDIIVSLIFCWL